MSVRNGSSPRSSEVSATPAGVASAPGLTAIPGNTVVHLDWTAPVNTGGDPVTVDVGQANDRWFINAASFGFGATSRTPSRLNCLGSSKRLGLHRRPSWPSVTDRSGF